MIKDAVVVARYTDAFFEFCKDTIGVDRALLELSKAKGFMRSNPEFKELLETPGIAFTDKAHVINEVFSAVFSEETRDFLKLLIDKGRIEYFFDIVEYAQFKYSHGGEVEATIKTSFMLGPDQIKKIEDALKTKFNKKFKFHIELDAALLGGIQVKIGNTVIDGSVKRRLEDLKEKLLAVQLN